MPPGSSSAPKLAPGPSNAAALKSEAATRKQFVDKALATARKRQMLLAMATGTGKTVTLVNQIYRLMKTGVAKRILFLVDRRALAAQAVRTFSSFEAEAGLKFDQIYEVYSQAFQKGDFDDDQVQRARIRATMKKRYSAVIMGAA